VVPDNTGVAAVTDDGQGFFADVRQRSVAMTFPKHKSPWQACCFLDPYTLATGHQTLAISSQLLFLTYECVCVGSAFGEIVVTDLRAAATPMSVVTRATTQVGITSLAAVDDTSLVAGYGGCIVWLVILVVANTSGFSEDGSCLVVNPNTVQSPGGEFQWAELSGKPVIEGDDICCTLTDQSFSGAVSRARPYGCVERCVCAEVRFDGLSRWRFSLLQEYSELLGTIVPSIGSSSLDCGR
jgi:hypothetical protein